MATPGFGYLQYLQQRIHTWESTIKRCVQRNRSLVLDLVFLEAQLAVANSREERAKLSRKKALLVAAEFKNEETLKLAREQLSKHEKTIRELHN